MTAAKKEKLSKKIIASLISVIIIIALYAWGFTMQTVPYSIGSDKIKDSMKIVFISDLHNCTYGGSDRSAIWQEIENAEPDLVLFGGDVIDWKGGTENALRLMNMINESYPCAYAPGNHEEMRSDTDKFYIEVENIGIPVLLGDFAEFDLNCGKVRVYGVLDAISYGEKATQLEECYDTLDKSYYNILLAHQPEQYGEYLGWGSGKSFSFDLILSGHAHGGQWRLPKLLEQGLYAPDQGLFPKYTNGLYEYGDTVHIISRGLARPMRMIFIPRIFNRPEVSIIKINKEINK